jgi:hypothetical protein
MAMGEVVSHNKVAPHDINMERTDPREIKVILDHVNREVYRDDSANSRSTNLKWAMGFMVIILTFIVILVIMQ